MSLQHVNLPIESCLSSRVLHHTVRMLTRNPGITAAAYDPSHASLSLDYEASELTLADVRDLLSQQGIVPMRDWLRLLLAAVVGASGAENTRSTN